MAHAIIDDQLSRAFHIMYHAFDTDYMSYLESRLADPNLTPDQKHAVECSLHSLRDLAAFIDDANQRDLGVTDAQVENWERDIGTSVRDAKGELKRAFKANLILLRLTSALDERRMVGRFVSRLLKGQLPAPVATDPWGFSSSSSSDDTPN